MVNFVALLESPQDGDGVLDRRLADENGLEAALERGVLLDVLLVFVECGGADATQVPPCESGFQHVRSVHRAFGRAGAHQRMELVNEKNNLPARFLDLLEHRLQAVFELAPIFGAGDERPEIERHQALGLQGFWNVACDNSPGDALHNRGLADARLADQHGIVFGAARQNLDDTANFLVAAYHRVELGAPGKFGQIARIALQRLEFLLGVRVRHTMRAAHGDERLENRVVGHPEAREQSARGVVGFLGEGQEQMLGRDEFILERLGLRRRPVQDLLQGRGKIVLRGAANLGKAVEQLLGFLGERGGPDAEARQDGRDGSLRLLDQRQQQMGRLELLVAVAAGNLLRALQRFLCSDRELVKSRGHMDPSILSLDSAI